MDSAQNVAFDVDMKKNVKLAERQLPVMKCKMDDGSVKYVLPVYGAGLWGPIWGYVAVNDDGNTIYGANFSHEGETPGLGARIADKDFQDEFVDKHLFQEGEFKGVVVLKKGQIRHRRRADRRIDGCYHHQPGRERHAGGLPGSLQEFPHEAAG